MLYLFSSTEAKACVTRVLMPMPANKLHFEKPWAGSSASVRLMAPTNLICISADVVFNHSSTVASKPSEGCHVSRRGCRSCWRR